MAERSDTPEVRAIDRSEWSGHVSLVLLLAGLMVGVALGLSFVAGDHVQPLILGLLALLAMAGVFFLFMAAVGALRLAGRGARNDLTKLMADKAAEALLVVEESGRVVYANESYQALAGADGGQNLRGVERVFTGAPEVSEAVYRLAQSAREGRPASEEMRVSPSPDGARAFAWYRVRVTPLPRAGGRTATLWSVADITQERERHETVFQELQHAIDYLDHAPAGFLSVDPGGGVVYMNATLAEWLGHDLAKVGSGGLRLGDLLPGDAGALMRAGTGAPGDVRTETLDLDLRRRTGAPLPVRLFHRVAFGADGRPGPSRTLVLNRSAGEGADEGQRAAEVRFARFFNNTPIAIATLGRDGRVMRPNASFARLFGMLPRTEAGGGGPSILAAVQERDRPALEAALRAAGEGRPEMAPLDLGIAGEGNRSARVWLAPVSDGEAGGEAAILHALDITEQRQLESQFAQAQKMQAVGQLAGGVAHDFNNVLQAIIGYSDLLLANHRPTDPSFQDIMQIKQNANRAASLVRQLLAFSRRQTLRPEVLNLGDTLSDLSMLLKRLLGERVELDLRHGRDLWPTKVDVNQLEQVIINLAVNARDAMPDGGRVSIRTANVAADEAERAGRSGLPRAEYVLIEVADTGTGIPPELIDKIYEPFFTTKEVGKGTGLGLSTVFGIVKQSNGYIYVDSKIGEGTAFSIYLPRHVPSAEEVSEEVKAPEAKAPAPDLTGHGTILLVEDEDAVRAVNGRALSARGYTVLEAASGLEALQIMEEHDGPVDLVVSDVVMPEMNGPTLVKQLRQRHPHLKVIFVSGYAEDAFRKDLPDNEHFNFLPKPFSLKQLVETVKQVKAG